MSIYNREQRYLSLLSDRPYRVEELAARLFISEPTVRRDIVAMKKKELIETQRGVVRLRPRAADARIPLFVREQEANDAKEHIARLAAAEVKEGDTLMLDASTTAYHLLPHIAKIPNVLIITNGAKTAIEATMLGIRTITVGGEMTPESFSYVGCDAEDMLDRYRADIAFFSCRGITEDGYVSDNSILGNAIRRKMMHRAKRSILLADRGKIGKSFLSILCHTDELSAVITDA